MPPDEYNRNELPVGVKTRGRGASLLYDSPLHKKILQRVKHRINIADEVRTQYKPRWEKCDELYEGYLDKSTKDSLKKNQVTSPKDKIVKDVRIPFVKMNVDTVHAHLQSVFLRKKPMIQLISRSGVQEKALQANEALIEYQITVGDNRLPVNNWFMDAVKYGVGILHHYWEDSGDRGFTGTRFHNVRPYDFLPDKSYTVAKMHNWEFCGRTLPVAWSHIVEQAKERPDSIFNLDNPRPFVSGGYPEDIFSDYDELVELNSTEGLDRENKRFTNLEMVEMYVKLVPSEWQLPKALVDDPALYDSQCLFLFRVINRKIIISAEQIYTPRQQFPFIAMGISDAQDRVFQDGLPLQIGSMAEYANWLINSRVQAVRKGISQSYIYDPLRLDVDQVKLTDGAAFYPVKRGGAASYGGGSLSEALQPIPFVDATQEHIRDLQQILDQAYKMTGLNDQMFGQYSQPRKSATEVRAVQGSVSSRLASITDFVSNTAMDNLGRVLLSYGQHFFSGEMKLRIAGVHNWSEQEHFVDVSREAIQGEFDIQTVDGGDPIDKAAQTQQFINAMRELMSNPSFSASFDMVKVGLEILHRLGVRNPDRFRLTPEEQMQRLQMAGGQQPPMETPQGGN